MKYGKYLIDSISEEYGADAYLDYTRLKQIIHELSEIAPSRTDERSRQVSLTTPAPTNAQGRPTVDGNNDTSKQESFVKKVDAEIAKIEAFTLSRVTELRARIDDIEYRVDVALAGAENNSSALDVKTVEKDADDIAEQFLQLEKYVNINFMGFHKILKKHDKHVPNHPCKAFFITRLHAQAWVRGDYSDVVVKLSTVYSRLRNDQAAAENADESQSFLRQTSKYWVKTEDVSRVKYAILRHLPVFLQKSSTGESDSQFTNSVYLDNDALELYHGRLDKSPGAIAIRLRWYGTGDPSLVFVERKTHRDKWTGEVSVKERFIIKEEEVEQVMNNVYPIEQKKREMIEKKGKSQKEADEWEQLVREITQAIQAKQLVPTMRTQCMRTAFQIPFDATVRISLDTNLCMITERGYDIQGGKVWHRDPNGILAQNEITRFPHAILEIKLEIKEGSMGAPQWVSDLQNSGLIYEVHKYSKFIHGCAVLLPEDAQSVPYWIDDASIRNSIIASGGSRILMPEDVGVGPGATAIYSQLLPFGSTTDDRTATAVGRTGNTDPTKAPNYGLNFNTSSENEDDDGDEECFNAFCSPTYGYSANVMAPTRMQKIEPKIFFANERTFLHYVHAGVTLYTIASGILAFSAESDESWAHTYALALLVIALGFVMYALHVFQWRADRIKTRVPGRWDDPRGPILLGSILVCVLTVSLVTKLYAIATLEPEL
mmetsp:Transcript_31907/g.48936  ORF Transcript_31907/g.48936 Transcript_31907/m.48936 type:complete len:715 (+) Transcript_31907:208-2352(+)|eukprot:CAMPEP_0195281416 /NCGR_PEP_ID=MMETSP0707-20130614/736_1 /TAXON_ID=33640 /ORGANISM="Asterionellopsis glacialis, Strain CCMP134" /LENGTH=714 /DNA_ID=CAMNT_0040340299 /DNA_START=194 /DNA_END=2338 /DNA_ORIENTATION=-